MVAQVARAASGEDVRPVLTGVHLDVGRTAHRGRHRLLPAGGATRSRGERPMGTALVPRRALEEARRSADASGEVFASSSSRPRSRSNSGIAGSPPGSSRASSRLPAARADRMGTSGSRVDRAESARGRPSCRVVGDANTSTTPVTLQISEDTVERHRRQRRGRRGRGGAAWRARGLEPLQIAFNPRYLSDGLDAIAASACSSSATNSSLRSCARSGPEDDGRRRRRLPLPAHAGARL
jgi:DNA polymerase III subunit beta